MRKSFRRYHNIELSFAEGLVRKLAEGEIEFALEPAQVAQLLGVRLNEAKSMVMTFSDKSIINVLDLLAGLIVVSAASMQDKCRVLFEMIDFDQDGKIDGDEFACILIAAQLGASVLTSGDGVSCNDAAILRLCREAFEGAKDGLINSRTFTQYIVKKSGGADALIADAQEAFGSRYRSEDDLDAAEAEAEERERVEKEAREAAEAALRAEEERRKPKKPKEEEKINVSIAMFAVVPRLAKLLAFLGPDGNDLEDNVETIRGYIGTMRQIIIDAGKATLKPTEDFAPEKVDPKLLLKMVTAAQKKHSTLISEYM